MNTHGLKTMINDLENGMTVETLLIHLKKELSDYDRWCAEQEDNFLKEVGALFMEKADKKINK